MVHWGTEALQHGTVSGIVQPVGASVRVTVTCVGEGVARAADDKGPYERGGGGGGGNMHHPRRRGTWYGL